jgi:hypothetical protein
MLVYESTVWLSIGSCLYVIFVSVVSVFVFCARQFLVLCRSMMRLRQHLSPQLQATSGIFPKLLLARALAVLQLLGSSWPVVWWWRLGWTLALLISSELRCNHGDGDGYIPSGELLGFPPSSTHSGTLVSQTLNRGDSVLRLCSVWLVLVQFYSMWLCCCKKLILIV